jgi:hypothetical protein
MIFKAFAEGLVQKSLSATQLPLDKLKQIEQLDLEFSVNELEEQEQKLTEQLENSNNEQLESNEQLINIEHQRTTNQH